MYVIFWYFRVVSYENFHHTGAKIPSAVFYDRANKISEDFLRSIMILMQASTISTALICATAGAIFYYVRDGHIEGSKLYLPFKAR